MRCEFVRRTVGADEQCEAFEGSGREAWDGPRPARCSNGPTRARIHWPGKPYYKACSRGPMAHKSTAPLARQTLRGQNDLNRPTRHTTLTWEPFQYNSVGTGHSPSLPMYEICYNK